MLSNMKRSTQTATERLTALQDRQRALDLELESARDQYRRACMELDEAINIVRSCENSLTMGAEARGDAAKIRADQLREQAEAENTRIVTIEGELKTATARIAALFDGQDGYEVAVAIYREAAAHLAKTESVLAENQAKQQSAALALDKAEQASTAATHDLENTMDTKSIQRARAVLDAARQAEGDARTLLENLQRYGEKLTAERTSGRVAVDQSKQRAFRLKAALLVDTLKQQLMTGPDALKAFAAASLSGSIRSRNFREWLGDVVDPRQYGVSPDIDAHKAALVAELETATE